jgi:hypothetical protein
MLYEMEIFLAYHNVHRPFAQPVTVLSTTDPVIPDFGRLKLRQSLCDMTDRGAVGSPNLGWIFAAFG